MWRTLSIVALCLPACQPAPVAKTNATTHLSPVTVSEPSPVLQDIKPLPWKRVPTTKVAVGQSIWLETVKSPEAALASLVSEAMQSVGGNLALGNPLAQALPKQPAVTWHLRTPGIERRVVMDAEVVLRQGFLEHLLSRSEAGKDHESIVSAPFDAEILHTALLGTGLQPGKPARFINEKREQDFHPATGDVVKLYFEYEDAQGKTVAVPAQKWVQFAKDGKPLETDWVYAGSFKGKSTTAAGEEFVYFGANDGRVVCLTNFGTALLDLPIESADGDPQGDVLGYKANTAVIPERGTRIRVIMEAAVKKK